MLSTPPKFAILWLKIMISDIGDEGGGSTSNY